MKPLRSQSLLIPMWPTSTNKLKAMFVLTLLLYCGSHTDCISPCAMATVLVMTSAVSVISTTTTTLLPLLQSLQLCCHYCKACNSTALQPSGLYQPCVPKIAPVLLMTSVYLFCLLLRTSYASTIILATTFILAIFLFNLA